MSWWIILILFVVSGYIALGFAAHQTGYKQPQLQLIIIRCPHHWWPHIFLRWVEGADQ